MLKRPKYPFIKSDSSSHCLQQTLTTYLIPTVRFVGHGDDKVELVQGGDVGGYDGHHVSSLDAK